MKYYATKQRVRYRRSLILKNIHILHRGEISLNAKIASKRRRSRYNDELSSWSHVSITSTAFPAETTPLEH